MVNNIASSLRLHQTFICTAVTIVTKSPEQSTFCSLSNATSSPELIHRLETATLCIEQCVSGMHMTAGMMNAEAPGTDNRMSK